MRKQIALSHNRSLTVCYRKADVRSKQWVVFLQESGAEFQDSSRSELEFLIGRDLSKAVNFLVVNKPGVTESGVHKEEFESSFRRNRRVKDALTAIQAIIPKTHLITLVGYSEGAYLAPEVALGDARVQSVILIGGGTRGWCKEELNLAPKNERKKVAAQLRLMARAPNSLEKWKGFSYATWNSYRTDKTLSSLQKLNIPILAILGNRDRTVDIKTTLQDLKKLQTRKTIQIEVLNKCSHSFDGHWKSVQQTLNQHLRFVLASSSNNFA